MAKSKSEKKGKKNEDPKITKLREKHNEEVKEFNAEYKSKEVEMLELNGYKEFVEEFLKRKEEEKNESSDDEKKKKKKKKKKDTDDESDEKKKIPRRDWELLSINQLKNRYTDIVNRLSESHEKFKKPKKSLSDKKKSSSLMISQPAIFALTFLQKSIIDEIIELVTTDPESKLDITTIRSKLEETDFEQFIKIEKTDKHKHNKQTPQYEIDSHILYFENGSSRIKKSMIYLINYVSSIIASNIGKKSKSVVVLDGAINLILFIAKAYINEILEKTVDQLMSAEKKKIEIEHIQTAMSKHYTKEHQGYVKTAKKFYKKEYTNLKPEKPEELKPPKKEKKDKKKKKKKSDDSDSDSDSEEESNSGDESDSKSKRSRSKTPPKAGKKSKKKEDDEDEEDDDD